VGIRRVKEYRRWLSAEDILHVRIVRDNGDVVEFAIGYELRVCGHSYHPCRVDNSHGTVHMDILDLNGDRVERRELPYVDPRRAIADGMEVLLDVIEQERERILQELGETHGT
jgi:hypothetical protein